MRVRKQEREAMISLLDQQHEDVESLASSALLLAWHHLINREWWCVVFFQPGVATTLHGPFESENMARKFATQYLVSAGPDVGTAMVRRMSDSGLAEGISE